MAETQRRRMIAWALAAGLVTARVAVAAVGCELDDPDRDVRRIFPQATGYRTEYITIHERGGDVLAAEVERMLGDRLDPLYESNDVPHAYYTVLKGREAIGRVHGVNQKGTYGAMQLILATDMEGRIVDFYYQRLSSREAKAFRDKAFTGQFKGLILADFHLHRSDPARTPLGAIRDPSQRSGDDFAATLRGLRKNLILRDIFFLDRAHDTASIDTEVNDAMVE